MKYLGKLVIGVVAAVVVLIVAAVIFLTLFFDANDYRDQITARVEQATGRSFGIGSIHLSVFPTLGLKLADARLGPAAGFGDRPFAQVGEVDVGVRILPLLLHRRLEVGTVYLSRLSLDLQKDARGRSNWSDLLGRKTSSSPTAKGGGGAPELTALAIGGVNVDSAQIRYRDAGNGHSYAISHFNLSTGAVGVDQPFDFRTSLELHSDSPQADGKISASGRLRLELTASRYQVQGLNLQVQVQGAGVPGGKQDLTLDTDLDYNGAAGSARLADARIRVAGVHLRLGLAVNGLGGGQLSYAGPIKIEDFSPRDLFEALGIAYRSADAGVLKKASLSAQLVGGAKRIELRDLRARLDQSSLTGSLGLSGWSPLALSFALKLDQFDADRYMAADDGGRGREVTPKGSAVTEQKLPFALLLRYGLDGRAQIARLTLHRLKLSGVGVKLSGPPGGDKQIALTARGYGGRLASTTRVVAGDTPACVESLQMESIDAGPLLTDLLGSAYVTGNAEAKMDLHGRGWTLSALRRTLSGEVAFAFTDGAVKGFNLGQILRTGQALLNQQPAPTTASGALQTDFSSLTVSGKITDGVLHTDDLAAASPLFRLTGAGSVNLVDMTVDYLAKPTLVNTATGQGGKQLDQLRGLTIPIHVFGPLSALKYRLNVEDALKQKAVDKLRQQLDKSKVPKNLKDKLQQLFGHSPPG
ncbi:MAG: AsmA family protein [Gammaproteobacteria bacterium]|nr:AsmA family protein [Gammaproteobacteria bacterium]